MLTITSFWILVMFYVMVKLCFFIGVYFITKAIQRRALREKKKRLETYRLFEIEEMISKRKAARMNRVRDLELFGLRRKRFVV